MSQKYTDPYSGKRKSLRHANQCAHKRRLSAGLTMSAQPSTGSTR